MAERVWDRFLTEQDRAHIALTPKTRRGLGRSPALVMVDVYRKVFGERPRALLEAIETDPGSCGLAAWDALPRLQELLRVVRECKVPVIHLTGAADVPRWSDTPEQLAEVGSAGRRKGYEVMDEVAPITGEPLIAKAGPSGFWGTPLAGLLTQLGVDTVVVAGESTSGCVRATVVDARSYRYQVAVVEDCIFDRHEASHAINLFDMDRKYADVMPLAEVCEYLRGVRSSARTAE